MTIEDSRFVEECWFIQGFLTKRYFFGILTCHVVGQLSSVEIKWKKALHSPFLIGWFHTHPGHKHLSASVRDHATMRSWVRGLGRPLYCGIICQDEYKCYKFFRRKFDLKTKTYPIVFGEVECKKRGPFVWGRKFTTKNPSISSRK